MKWRRFIAACATLFVLSFNTAAHAGLEDPEEILNDGRTEGYLQKVQIPKPSTLASVWLAFIAALGHQHQPRCSKDAKRTHLD